MDLKSSFKNDFCLGFCCVLSVTIITAVVFSLDGEKQKPSADFALDQANISMSEYCAKNGISPCNAMLVDVTPPKDEGDWSFEYYSPQAGPVSVAVQGDGEMEVITKPVAEAKGAEANF
jgi:hypothetical protein